MKLGRPAALATAMLVVLSCAEPRPRPTDEDAGPDAAAGAPDATISIEVDIADAGTDVAEIADAATEAEASTPPIGDGGDCGMRLESPALVDSPHVPAGTAVNYSSNPPSSGPHYPVWANFQEFSTVVPDGNLVHSMEHGAVLLLYNCNVAEPACAGIVSALRAIRDAIATDPSCDPSIRVRVVIAPRPLNDTVVAAAAWGQTYRADCVDPVSLTKFVNDHYGKGPEDLCAAGQIAF